MKRNCLTCLILLLASCEYLMGQPYPFLSQSQFNQVFLNPAYSGVNGLTSFDFQIRNQWIGIEGSPTTAILTAQTTLPNEHMGTGLIIIRDEFGIMQSTDVAATYAYRISFNETTKLAFGLQASLTNVTYDYTKLNLENIDEDFSGVAESQHVPNFGTGIFLSGRNYYAGLSIPRLLSSEDQDIGIKRQQLYAVSAGYIFENDYEFKYKPYVQVLHTPHNPLNWEAGINAMHHKSVWLGLFTRRFESFGLMTSFTINNRYRMGYQGEILGSQALSGSFTSHEIFIGLDLDLFAGLRSWIRYY